MSITGGASSSPRTQKELPNRLPEVGQLGIVVKDREKAISYYSETFNIRDWNRVEYKPEKATWNGKSVYFEFKLAFADTQKLNWELVEVSKGQIQHNEFLQKTGGGIHHLGFWVDDLDLWKEYFEKKGVPAIMEFEGVVGSRGRRRVVFFDASPGGVLLEFIKIL